MNDLKRILIAEDNENDLELVLTALGESNLANEVVVTRDGTEALDYLYQRGNYGNRDAGNPAVIFLDMKMPKVDGLEVLRVIRSDAALKNIPVVIVTSSREEGNVVESYKLGANAYVVKPVDFSQFIEAIKHLGVFWALVNEPPPGSVSRTKIIA